MTDEEKARKKAEDAAYERISVARQILKNITPYYSNTAYSLVPIAVGNMVDTICTTDRLVLGFNETWLNSLTEEEVAGALWHETQHVVGEHFSRGSELPDKELVNLAGDLAINCSAKHVGFTLPSGAFYPKDHGLPDDLSMEQYYDLILNGPQPEQPKKKKGGGGSGNGPPQQNPNTRPASVGVCAGKCGGVAGHGDQDTDDKINAAAEKETPGCVKGEAEVQAVIKQAAKDILDHVAQHGRGTIPAHLIDNAKFALRPPKVNWRTKLRRIVRRSTGRLMAGGADYSKARPSKRTYMRGIIVPGLIKRQATIALIRDTSGSMGPQQLQDAQNEAVGVMKAMGVDTAWFLDADAAVGAARMVRIQDIARMPITGRGGTDFGPALEHVSRLRPRPKLVLYFTDGDGEAPARPPNGMDVIWVIVHSYYNKSPATWGHTIFVDDPAQDLSNVDDDEPDYI